MLSISLNILINFIKKNKIHINKYLYLLKNINFQLAITQYPF